MYDQGFISLDILSELSITTEDGSFIDFGQCKLLDRVFNITSDGLKDTFESCEYYERTNISVRNDGGVVATVTVKSNEVGALRNGSFLSSPSNVSDIAYKVSNEGREGNSGGCLSGIGPGSFSSFLVVDDEYEVCEQLGVDVVGGENSVVIDFELVIPDDVDVGFSTVLVTFTAFEY